VSVSADQKVSLLTSVGYAIGRPRSGLAQLFEVVTLRRGNGGDLGRLLQDNAVREEIAGSALVSHEEYCRISVFPTVPSLRVVKPQIMVRIKIQVADFA